MIKPNNVSVVMVSLFFITLPAILLGGEQDRETTTPVMSLKNQPELTNLSGQAIIQQLLDIKSRSPAFYELCRRNMRNKKIDYDSFLNTHYDPEVIPCPQGEGKTPLYVVLYSFLDKETFSIQEGYELLNPTELFPPSGDQNHTCKRKEPAIEVFTAEGKRIKPFGGNNVLNGSGILADINGDSFVERADHTSYGIDGIPSVDVLNIVVVQPQPKTLLSVLYNWGEDEWTYRLTDPNKDGVLVVELGPKTPEGIKPKIVYTWDKTKKMYSGPSGGEGDHFRLLNIAQKDTFKDLNRGRKTNLVFPKDPDFIDNHTTENIPWRNWGREKPSPDDLAKPYHYASLKGLSNEDLIRYMGEGKNTLDLKWKNIIKTHVPSNFWILDPKSAALALANANRYPNHQKNFRLAVDDRDGLKPPDTGSIAFTEVSDKSYTAIDRHYFLRVDPKRSYLAYASARSAGVVFYNAVHDQSAFDFRFCEIPYEEARHFAHTVWWLNRVRSFSTTSSEGISLTSSTADGEGNFSFLDDRGNIVFQLNNILWASHVSERWQADFTPEVCLNFTAFLFVKALTDHVGDRWSKFDSQHSQDMLRRKPSSPHDEQDKQRNLQTLSKTFLDLFSLDQSSISFAIVKESARAAGDFVYTNLSSKLADIQTSLPTATTSKRTEKEIQAEIDTLDTIKPDDKGWKNAMKRQTALHKELMALYHDTGANDVQALKNSITLSQRKIQCANDLPALQDWARSKDPGSQWALQRLRDKSPKDYVTALEWWINNTNEKWARQAFSAIAEEDSKKASEIAKKVSQTNQTLIVSAFGHLTEVGELSNKEDQIRALINIALDPKNGWESRIEAIELLVPPDQPLRYPAKAIDDFLVKLLRPSAKDGIDFTIGYASRALARRGRTEYFDKMEKILMSTDDGMEYGEVLGSLTQLAQCDPARYNPRIQSILQPQMKKTKNSVEDLLIAAWSSDLREMKPDIEQIATSVPDDYEDEKARSYSSEAYDLNGRFHLARKIVALWNEEDAETRCKLLLAFGFNKAYDFVDHSAPEQLTRMKLELLKSAQLLTQEQRRNIFAFLQWYQCEYINKEREEVYRERRVKFKALAQDALNLH